MSQELLFQEHCPSPHVVTSAHMGPFQNLFPADRGGGYRLGESRPILEGNCVLPFPDDGPKGELLLSLYSRVTPG